MNKNEKVVIEKKILTIFVKLFDDLLRKLQKDFPKKKEIKEKQFLYRELLDEELLVYLALTSSLESKVGNTLNSFLEELIKDKEIMDFLGWLSLDEMKNFFEEKGKDFGLSKKGFFIGTDWDVPNIDLSFLRGKKKNINNDILKEKIQKIIREKEEGLKRISEVKKKYLDLVLVSKDRKKVYLFEIKAGGNIDYKKAETEIANLIKSFLIFRKIFENSDVCVDFLFATLYNPYGEDSNWKGSVATYLDERRILIGKNFWEFLFQNKISFEEFRNIYANAAKETKFIEKIKNMLKK